MTSETEENTLLTTHQAAEMLGTTERTLRTYRFDNVGPPYVKLGRSIRYSRDALINYIDERTVCPNKREVLFDQNRADVGAKFRPPLKRKNAYFASTSKEMNT